METKVGSWVLGLCVTGIVGPSAAALNAIEDNNVLRSAATTVQGNGQVTTFTLKEATSAQSNSRIGYIKFDIASIAAGPQNGVVTFKTGGTASTDFELRAFALRPVATGYDWSESGITFADRPAYSTDTNTYYLDAALTTALGSPIQLANGTAGGESISFPIVDVNAFRQSDNTLTIILLNSDQVENGPSLSIASSESASPPTLTIPEPGTASLLAIAATGLLARRRREHA